MTLVYLFYNVYSFNPNIDVASLKNYQNRKKSRNKARDKDSAMVRDNITLEVTRRNLGFREWA